MKPWKIRKKIEPFDLTKHDAELMVENLKDNPSLNAQSLKARLINWLKENQLNTASR